MVSASASASLEFALGSARFRSVRLGSASRATARHRLSPLIISACLSNLAIVLLLKASMFSFFLFFSFLYSIFLIDIVIFLTMTQIWTFNLKIKHIFEYSKILPCPVLFCLCTTHEFTDSCFHLLNNVLHQFPIEPFFLSPRF